MNCTPKTSNSNPSPSHNQSKDTEMMFDVEMAVF